MPRFGPVKRQDLIRYLRQLGFAGPLTSPSTLPKDIVDGKVQRTQDIGTERLATCQGLRTAIARTVWLRVLRHRCRLDLDEPYLRNPVWA